VHVVDHRCLDHALSPRLWDVLLILGGLSGSLDDIARHLEAAAIPFVRGRAGLPQIFCEDPAGNLVELNTGWTQQPPG
jgi:hypothetical protein